MDKPLRLYRGTTYVVSVRQPMAPEAPVLYDNEGFPVRWVTPRPPREPMGFHLRRSESDDQD